MEANELRLNNYYQLRDGVLGGGICRISFMEDFGKMYELMDSNSVTPIPLTEEWLLKFGFEKKDDDYRFNVFSFTFDENTFYNHVGKITNIYYVHQLQNLYFALTGDELTAHHE